MALDLADRLDIFFWLVLMASIPSVIWFFRVRKLMIKRHVYTIEVLEEKLRPKDKRYTVHGYLVGFTAKYWVYRGPVERVWIYYSTPPHHVFFYLPVIYLLGKHERLDLTFELKRPLTPGKAHIYDPHDRHTKRTLRIDLAKERLDKFNETVLRYEGREYKALYTRPEALDMAKQLFYQISSLARVTRVSVDAGRRAVHVSIIPKLATLPELLDVIYKQIKQATTEE